VGTPARVGRALLGRRLGGHDRLIRNLGEARRAGEVSERLRGLDLARQILAQKRPGDAECRAAAVPID
jgi:hypothetical protein